LWLDKTDIKPGYRWKDAIREAISEGDFFIACFSEAYQEDALTSQGKHPQSAIVDWEDPPTFELSATISEPSVVHVFGRLDVPGSLLLTVDDQMELTQRKKLPSEVSFHLRRNSSIWLGFDSKSVEQRIMDSLNRSYDFLGMLNFFDKKFETAAEQEGRPSILLREFMAELWSRWERSV
jgi:hypothetical protein